MRVPYIKAMKVISFNPLNYYCKIPPLATESKEIVELILKYLMWFFPSVTEMETLQNLKYYIQQDQGHYLFFKEGKCFASCFDPYEFLCHLRGLVERHIMDVCPNDAQLFHGSAVVNNGVCLCILAPSGCGKSSLAFGLCQHGWEYVADDLLLLHDDMIQKIPLPIEFRKGIEIDSHFCSYQLGDGIGEKDIYVLPLTDATIDKIFIVVLIKSDSSTSLRKMTAGEAYVSLLDNLKVTFSSTTFLRSILHTAKKHPVYSLSNCNMYEALSLLDNLKNE